jgi:hypothetical protein
MRTSHGEFGVTSYAITFLPFPRICQSSVPLCFVTFLVTFQILSRLLTVLLYRKICTMAKMLTINTADFMAPTLQFPEYHEPTLHFPEYKEPLSQFPEYHEPPCHFPEYHEPIEIMANFEETAHVPANKLVEQVIRTPGRQPSPQPTHFSVPLPYTKNGNGNGNGNGHRVLRSATVGYIAPEFKGKKAQMAQG